MQIALLLDPSRLCRWHAWILDALAARGLADVTVQFTPSAHSSLPAGLELLLRLERRTGRAAPHGALDAMSAADPAFARRSRSDTPHRLVIDLGGAERPPAGHAIAPLFDGSPDERALWLALLAGRAPAISVMGGGIVAPVAMALPALESPSNLHSAASTTFARVAEALAIAACAISAGRDLAPRMSARLSRSASQGTAPGFAARLLAGKLQQLVDRRLQRSPAWSVAYRSVSGGRTHPPAVLDAASFTRLPDDGLRYYADPFLFLHGSSLHLFVEEFPYQTGRGVISHAVLAADGRFTTPRVVLERPYHLSYPQVFARDGAIWMLPEASQSGAIELYRADPFPGRFSLHARLIEGSYHDATLFEAGGRLWIAAGHQCIGGSTWDALDLFYADRLDGPWTAHARNPVLVDARCARPGGALYEQDGALWRPSQDCSGGYGSALTLARVDELTPDTFGETPVTTLRLGGAQPRFGGSRHVSGPHTINCAGGIEVIDAFAPPAWSPRG